MTMTVIIVDDESHAREVLEDHLSRLPGLLLGASFGDPLQALQQADQFPSPQLWLVDIDMPGLNGLQLAGLLPRHGASLVFTTSHRQFGPEAFELGATDYLLKPVGFERFLHMLSKLKNGNVPDPSGTGVGFLLVKTGSKGHWQKIRTEDIIYVEGAQNYVDICTAAGKITTYLTLAEVEARLEAPDFRRVHRSFLLNTAHLSCLEAAQVEMSNGHILPVGRAYRKDFQEAMLPFTLSSSRTAGS